ncbi:D-beta-hydroxybutyrate dehydrogenase, mitochondrial [Pectinophora gossypiella]|uniref:D-beta-hydroxybutyrate dehydrogenase, mitochondrial n=1 Tax=Pectinophora gossypiella TaxID=13191 RepID=UPI00214F508E|nr:D-beta-hydroxybutyrate dehydrogenase, mitochondrial [Pectinophora gossypiella]XP_049868837.1 D-beta-hydroxybutyrate dehydrogenase, mitochondrial [Pectinophora gossypiella]
MAVTRVIAITGCDSGLGWAIAARAARQGLVTVAGMYQGTETNAAQALKKLRAHTCELDVTRPESVAGFKDYVTKLIEDNTDYKLYALVNNAGIMPTGDFECQTWSMIENVININLLGSMRVTSAFLPDLRRNAIDGTCRPRIINVASHCGLEPLPAFGPYSASKAGLFAWTRSLRYEHRPHGLAVAAFVPGGFVTSSNILASQEAYGEAMLEHLDEEQKLFYEKKIQSVTKHLRAASQNTSYDSLKDEMIIETFMKALLVDSPKEIYKVESMWRYKIYYTLLKLPLPEAFHYWLIKKFRNFPE